MSNDRFVDLSNKFVLSSGTISIDTARRCVLVLYHRRRKLYLLPKGRKNVGESLHDAAVRETMEESGHTCQLLKHNLPTHATEATTATHIEPIAIQQRFLDGIRKIIFWYLAEADSSETPHPNNEAWEDFESQWASFEEAPEKLSFADDREIVKWALQAIPETSGES